MKNFPFRICLTAVLLFNGLAHAFDPKMPTMDAKDLRAGMKGYGLSVFHGSEPEKFDVEILGVLHDRFVDGDMIIVNLVHPIMDNIGGIAGMSGSPIFVDDKLVGAFAYGWSFEVRAIGGVTPIKRMLTVMDLVTKDSLETNDEKTPNYSQWPEAKAAFANGIPKLPDFTVAQAELAALGVPGLGDATGTATFQPLMTPLSVSTRSPLVMKAIENAFVGTTLRPVMSGLQGGVSGDKRDDPAAANAQMKNGAALSVILCDGDLTMAGLGTATYVEGDKLVAFGHPMFGSGATDVPITVSEVVAIVPSVERPFKVGNALRTVGALRQDRLPAIGAQLGVESKMLPLKIHLNAPEARINRDFNFRVWQNRRYVSGIVTACILETLDSVREEGSMSMQLDYTVRLADGRKLTKRQYLSGQDAVPAVSALLVMSGVDSLASNRFEPVAISSIEASLEVGDRQKVMIFDRFSRETDKIEPGHVFHADFTYARWRQKPVHIPVDVPIPKGTKPGAYQIQVIDGGTRLQLERAFHPELDQIESVDDILDRREPDFPRNALYVLLIDPTEQLVLDGQPLNALPTSIANTVRATVRDSKESGTTKGRLLWEKRIPFDAMVAGSTTIPVTVVEKE
ncbi:SpoIVB peptidase S55 domain-containing protein [soil metagenome]